MSINELINSFFTPEVITSLKLEIEAHRGREVYFIGSSVDGKVVEVEVWARGNTSRVPAILRVLEPGNVIIHNHPSGVLEPSLDDLDVASMAGEEGVGFYIINNQVTEVCVVVKIFEPVKRVSIPVEKVTHFFLPEGLLAQKIKDFEIRPSQLQMVEAVSEALNNREVLVVEAGTGTGKTFAYLFPIAFWAKENKEKVVVSTNTINLQEQLIYKDIPLLQSVLPFPFKVVLMKGRNNYLCLRKVSYRRRQLYINLEEELQKIFEWSDNTSCGSISELNFIPSWDVWEQVCSERETCQGIKCCFYEKCFFYRARKDAASADILVINHHLLFSHLALEGSIGKGILPKFKNIVLDEAHHLEEVATKYFSLSFSFSGLQKLISRGFSVKGKVMKGLLADLEYFLSEKNQKLQQAKEIFWEAKEKIKGIQSSLVEFIYSEVNNKYFNESYKIKVTQPVATLIRVPLEETLELLLGLVKSLEELEKDISSVEKNDKDFLMDFNGLKFKILARVGEIKEFIKEEETEKEVKWIEMTHREGSASQVPKSDNITFVVAPLDIRDTLKRLLFDPMESIIFTSATLTVDKSFSFFLNQTGLDTLERKVNKISLPSSFDYAKQAIVAVPLDFPLPDKDMFLEVFIEFLQKLILLLKGRTFVLFTSYQMLERVYKELQFKEGISGMLLLKQGQFPRYKLLELFKSGTSSVLLATDSFWEGVDVIGEALECVVIVKLPFPVPSDPLIEAKGEYMIRNGKDPFWDYLLPKAVIKLRQGFGRLIRTSLDKGIVVICDSRVVLKSYGEVFLRSLPPSPLVLEKTEDLFKAFRKFLFRDINIH